MGAVVTESAAARGAPPLQEYLRAHLVVERARKRLSQSELAKRAGVSRYTIVKLESGEDANPRLDVLGRIAFALGVPVHELLAPIADPHDASDAELERRAETPAGDYVDAERLLSAVEEAAVRQPAAAGRRRSVARTVPSRRR
jgi:transcriptional regulator with XRE-family HTH domain